MNQRDKTICLSSFFFVAFSLVLIFQSSERVAQAASALPFKPSIKIKDTMIDGTLLPGWTVKLTFDGKPFKVDMDYDAKEFDTMEMPDTPGFHKIRAVYTKKGNPKETFTAEIESEQRDDNDLYDMKPAAFYPENNEKLVLEYKLVKEGFVTICASSGNNETEQCLVKGQKQVAGVHRFVWNGRDEKGKIMKGYPEIRIISMRKFPDGVAETYIYWRKAFVSMYAKVWDIRAYRKDGNLILRWQTDRSSNCTIEFGRNPKQGMNVLKEEDSDGFLHEAVLGTPVPGKYFYRIKAESFEGLHGKLEGYLKVIGNQSK